MINTRHKFLGIALGLTAGVALAASAEAQTPKKGGTAVLALTQDPGNLIANVSNNLPDRMVGCITHQGLAYTALDLSIKPQLAKSWSVSPDGLTYTFELTKAEWHDGKPLTSEDVKYTIQEISSKYSATFGAAARSIDTIETPAPDKVVIKLKQPFGPFLMSMSCIGGSSVQPAHVYQGTDPRQNPATTTKSIGTGAFMMSEWKRGDYIRLVKNPKYWEPGKPYLDEVIGKVLTNSATRLQALQAGEVDIVEFFPGGSKAAVLANPKLKIEQSDQAPESSMAFINVSNKPLDDKRVRQALMLATDRDYLMKNAFFDIGAVGVAPFTTEIKWAANPDIDYRKMYPFDIAKANALLDEAGVKRGADGKRFAVRVMIFANQYPEFQVVAPALKSMWGQVGIDVNVEALEDQTYIKKVFVDRDFDVTLQLYTSYADPVLGIARTFTTGMIAKPYGNPTGYSNPEVDALFDKGEKGVGEQARGVFYKQVQTILAQDLPVLQLRQYTEIDGATKRLQGLWGKSIGTGHWSDAWVND